MKQILKLTLLCLITGILFSSCTSKITLTKRLYNDGYFVSYKDGNSKTEATQNTKTALPDATLENENFVQAQDDQISLESPVALEQENTPPTNTVDNETALNEKNSKEPIHKKILSEVKSIAKNISPVKRNTCSVSSSTNDTDEAYSLLWILVLVLLILWLLGYLAGGLGLGGLINILLVIALILLILWLLRVI